MQGEKIKQIILRVPIGVHTKLKTLASMQGKTMEGLIVELIQREGKRVGLKDARSETGLEEEDTKQTDEEGTGSSA